MADKFSSIAAILLVAICLLNFLPSQTQVEENLNNIEKYKSDFPHRAEVSYFQNLGRINISLKHGASTAGKYEEIYNSYTRSLDKKYELLRVSETNNIYWKLSTAASTLLLFIMHFGFCRPIRLKIINGEIGYIYTAKNRQAVTPQKPYVYGFENLMPYSVANELKKWSALKDSGVISDEEYRNMKKKLLS